MSGNFGFSKSKQSSKPVDITPPQYQNLRQHVGNTLQDFMQSGGPSYQGPFVAPITNEELASLDRVKLLSQGRSNLSSLGRGETERTLRGDYLDPASNPFLRSTVDAAIRPISQAREEANLADRASFARAGQRLSQSSPFARAYNIGERGYADAIGDVSTKIYGANYDAERNRQVGAVAQADALDSAELTRTLEGLKAAALPRLIADLGIERGMAEFTRRAQMILDAAGIAVNASTLFGNKSKSNTTQFNAGVEMKPDPATAPL